MGVNNKGGNCKSVKKRGKEDPPSPDGGMEKEEDGGEWVKKEGMRGITGRLNLDQV